MSQIQTEPDIALDVFASIRTEPDTPPLVAPGRTQKLKLTRYATFAEEAEYRRDRMKREVGLLLLALLDDGRDYAVNVKWQNEDFEWQDKGAPAQFRLPVTFKPVEITLRALVRLRHWQDAAVGEFVVPEAIAPNVAPGQLIQLWPPFAEGSVADADCWSFRRVECGWERVA